MVPWLAGQSYSVADIMNFGWLRAPEYAGVRLPDYPAVHAWVERIAARPAAQRGLQATA
jgi:GST-like protein